jgi:hypothetical protein
MIVTDGLEDAATALSARWTNGEAGTDNTAPAATQTALITPIVATNATLTNTVSGKSFQTSHFIPSTTATGNEFFEWEVETAAGVMISRAVTAGVNHTATDEITKITTFNMVDK